MPSVDYAQARPLIESGDVLCIQGRSALSPITRLLQRLGGLGALSRYTHVGVAWWVEGRLYAVEMDGLFNVLRPLSQHVGQGSVIAVYRPLVAEAMARHYDRATASAIHYRVLDLAKIGLRLITRGRLFANETTDDDEMVCSSFAAVWLTWAGWAAPHGFPALPSPAELARALGQPVLEVSPAES